MDEIYWFTRRSVAKFVYANVLLIAKFKQHLPLQFILTNFLATFSIDDPLIPQPPSSYSYLPLTPQTFIVSYCNLP